MGNKNDEIMESLNWRYAVKKFDPTRKVSNEDWETLENSLVLAPSSFGFQPYKFIVVTDPAVKERLAPAAYGQSQITDASHIVVFAYKKELTELDVEKYVHRIADVRSMQVDDLRPFEATMKGSAQKAADEGSSEVWNSRQVYIALGFLLETAALLKIDACPMEGFDAAKFNEILGLEGYSAVAVCALGYRDEENDWLAQLPKVRMPNAHLVQRV